MFRFTSCTPGILVQRSNFKEKNRKFLKNWIEINNIKWMLNLIRLWLRKLKGKITSFTMRFKWFYYDNILIQIFRWILHFWRFIVPNLAPYFSLYVNYMYNVLEHIHINKSQITKYILQRIKFKDDRFQKPTNL